MKAYRIILIIFILSVYHQSSSQPSTCGAPIFETTCQAACVTCGDIDGLMLTTLENQGGNLPPGFCTAFSHTSSWVGFVAGSTNLDLNVAVGACTGIATEMGIYEGCDCSNYNLVSNCNTMMNANTTYGFNATGLVVGQYYWLVFDGNGESACDVTFSVISGSTGSSGSPTIGPITGDQEVCINDLEEYSIPEVGTCNYNWTLDGGGIFTTGTGTNVVNIQWTTSGDWQLCAEPEVICAGSSEVCIDINVSDQLTPTEVGPEKICEGDLYVYDGDGMAYGQGEHVIQLISSRGCDSFVTLIVEEFPNENVELEETICAPDCYQVGSQDFCESGDYEVMLMMANEPFCDSTVSLLLNVLSVETMVEKDGDLGCDNDLVTLDGGSSLISGDGDIEYTWRDETGAIVGTDPTLDVMDEGTYTLTITITSFDGDVSCFDVADIEVTGSSQVPELEYNNTLILCDGDSINLDTLSIIDLNNTGGVITFHSDSPADNTNLLSNTTVAPNSPTTYFALSSLGSCGDEIPIPINLGPEIYFYDTIRICQGDMVELNLLNIIDSNNTAATYTFHSDVPTSMANLLSSSTVVPSADTVFYARAEFGPCTDEVPILIEVAESVPLSIGGPYVLDCNTSSVRLDPGFQSGAGYTVTWTDALGVVINNPDSVAVSVQNPGWYYIESFGSNVSCIVIDSVEVTEDYALPNLTTQDTSTFSCGDVMIELVGNTDFAFPGLTWYWTTTSGSIVSDPNSDRIDVDAPGEYLFIITSSANGCSDTVEQVVVPDQNIPSLSTDPVGTIDCINDRVVLSANGQSSNGSNISYQWTTMDGVIMGNPNAPTLTVMDGGSYRIEIIDDGNGCRNAATLTVLVDTISPVVSFTSDLELDCIQSSAMLFPIQAENSDFDYQWNTADGSLPMNPNQHTIEVMEEGTYVLTVINRTNGCRSSESITVTEDVNTPLSDIVVPGILTCEMPSIVLDASNSSDGPEIDYDWSSTDGNFIDMSDRQRVEVDEPGTYQLVITNTNNFCSDTVEVEVMSNETYPIISIATPDSLGCENAEVQIVAQVSNSMSNTTQWSTLDGSIVSSTTGNTITVDLGGTYVFRVEDLASGCISEDSVRVGGVATGPTGFDLMIDEGLCLGEESSIFISNVVGGEAPYRVELNGVGLDFDTNEAVFPGDYVLVVYDENDCIVSDTFTIRGGREYPVNIGLDFTITAGDYELLIPQFGFDTSIIESLQWSPSEAVSCDTCIRTEFISTSSVEVILEVLTEDGCRGMADIFITVIPSKDVYIPNSFSPNADKLNDYFTVFARDGRVREVKHLRVFNRWGDMVFEKENFPPNVEEQGWDGRQNGEDLNPEVFIFTAEVEFINGSTQLFSGDITLLK